MNDQYYSSQTDPFADADQQPVTTAAPRTTWSTTSIVAAVGLAVALALVLAFFALRGPSWEQEVRAAVDAEMAAMTPSEQSDMCFAMSFLGIEDGSGLLGAAAAFASADDFGLESLPEGVDVQEVFDVAVDQLNSYC